MLLARYQVLVLCTGNSARSIIAEVLFNQLAGECFRAWSAGSQALGRVNPYALEILQHHGHDIGDCHSKSWQAFCAPDAPAFDFVVTVCGKAAGEQCLVFQGAAERVHWPLPDPVIHSDSPEVARQAFAACYQELRRRVERACALSREAPGDHLGDRLRELAGEVV